MDNDEFELLLFDRIEVIKSVNDTYDLLNNAYLSFSGGKDSTILHYLLDLALPNNKIPRVFIDTGIEYNDIREFVLFMSNKDDRFVIIKPIQPIMKILNQYGYPFKSKEHSSRLFDFNKGNFGKYLDKYVNGCGRFSCPSCLKYQFKNKGQYNFSHYCCIKLKKQPVNKWCKSTGKTIVLTGMRKSEGGQRINLRCVVTDKQGHLKKFHPLTKVDDVWEDYFINKFNIELCKLYYPPYNFKRTGCKGCPFNLDLQFQLDTMSMYLPHERKQCEIIWKYVYDEYRRIGYRLKNNISVFD